jgi:F-type H+-transporting ATPase subunit gamma
MASTKIVRRRITSAKNIKQITKAMEMVSASKMRRAQQKALSTRPYSTKLKEILAQLSNLTDTEAHPMMKVRETAKGTVGVVLVSSNRGLCGALNTNLFRATEEFKESLGGQRPEEVVSFEFITVGKKSREYVLKTGQTLHAEFTNLSERPSFEDVLPISRLAIEGFSSERFAQIYIVYTAFISTLTQEVKFFRLLPIESEKFEKPREEIISGPMKEYIFEPRVGKVLEWLLPHYIEIEVFHATLEALASEHSARMVSMRNASDNAKEIIADLTLIYNKQRQQAITNELSDMITARMAVS